MSLWRLDHWSVSEKTELYTLIFTKRHFFHFSPLLYKLNSPSSGAYCNESDSKDYLEIRNGYEDDAPPLNAVTRDGGDADAYFCGRTAPSNLISSGNEVLINFKSDDIHSDTGSYPGFQLRYRAVGTGCGGDYVISESDPAGWFTSPNYPDNYDSNEFCIYTIRGDPGISIRLEDQQTT